jgi:hypothetical protein
MTHFLYCPFTGLGLHNGYRGDEWLKNRIKIFKQFVVPSLLNQTNRNFILWISWRPEEENNLIVNEFRVYLALEELNVVHTFNGLCFWDDKYPDAVAASRLTIALTETLPQLRQYVNSEWVYMTIQPSDDMYLKDAIADIQDPLAFELSNLKTREVLYFNKGYIFRYATRELAEYNPETFPPFYTIKFTAKTFLDPEAHIKYTGPYKSHEYVKDYLNTGVYPKRYFIVGTHGENISTVFNHPYKGRSLIGDERNEILDQAGILDVPKLDVKKTGLRLYSRIILNKLPFQKQLRNLYHKCLIQPF